VIPVILFLGAMIGRRDDIEVMESEKGVKPRLRIFDPQSGTYEETIDLKDSE
jgi:hypothetical protein